MDDTEETKQEAIAEINRMVKDWSPRYCRYLMQDAKRMHEAATAPPPIIDKKTGKAFSDYLCIHIQDEERGTLCGHGEQIVSAEEFEEIPSSRKCEGCKRALKKLQGENVLANCHDWLRETQEQLLLTIYRLSGQRTGVWCLFKDLQAKSQYSSPEALRRALQRLERRGVLERKGEGRCGYVRLVDSVIRRTRGGQPCVHIGPRFEQDSENDGSE